MQQTANPRVARRHTRQLHAVADVGRSVEGASAPRFSETVRAVVGLTRRRGLRPPVFRSPPGLDGIDRSIRRRRGTVVVAVRREGRPLAAVQADVIEGVVAANDLSGADADRFRHEAWAVLRGSEAPPPRRATMEPEPPARVA
jgi:hypothetical protein